MSKEKENKPSAVEEFKLSSDYLRGEIPEELVDGNAFFGKSSIQLLKHHGTYQQDNRDERKAARDDGRGKAYSMMIRTRIPGGRLTSAQLLAEIDLCDEIGNTTLRITTRQGLQLHGVVKDDLQRTIERINDVQLSTLGACGDVNRNVMCCPAPYGNDPVHAQMQTLANDLANHFAPRTRAYHELWLNNGDDAPPQLVGGGADEVEPIYGKTYMPRKFKMGIALPGDNCIDVYTQDLGLLAVCSDFKIIGYNFIVGGGFGVTPSAAKTFPAVGKRMAFVPVDQVIKAAEAVVKVQRDFGNRSDRKVARLKYVIADWGIEKFKAKVEEYFGGTLADPEPDDVTGYEDHLGWHHQCDDLWFYGLNVENGRIQDKGNVRLKQALRDICGHLRPGIRLTAHQSILFTDIAEDKKGKLEEMLRRNGIKLLDEISAARRWSMACPAMPTCGLAVSESERVLPEMIDDLEVELAKLGLSEDVFTIRMTGCPNGCARPYNADVGLVGKTLGKYTVLLGGRRLGDRLNFIYQDVVPADEVIATLVPLLTYFKQDRLEGETFGDFCHRKGNEDLQAWTSQLETQN
ncbi:MAG: NADPH-dependent assimilatory sulfite reductase hemoprotein subunit [Pirellulales bacterium]